VSRFANPLKKSREVYETLHFKLAVLYHQPKIKEHLTIYQIIKEKTSRVLCTGNWTKRMKFYQTVKVVYDIQAWQY